MGEGFRGLQSKKGVSCAPIHRRVLLPEGKRFIREPGGRLRGKGATLGGLREEGRMNCGWHSEHQSKAKCS